MDDARRVPRRGSLRKRLVAAVVGLAIAGLAVPVPAYVAHVTTSVPVENVQDETRLQEALAGAVKDVLQQAIGFTPALVVLTHVFVVGDRLYVRLLVADEEGARVFDEPDAPSERERGKTEL